MAKTQKSIKRSDGHTQKYTVGTDRTVPLAGSAVPSAHATSAANTSFDAPAAESTDYRSHITLPNVQSIPDSDTEVTQLMAEDGEGYALAYKSGFELDTESGQVRHFAVHADSDYWMHQDDNKVDFTFANPLSSESKAEILALVTDDLGRLTDAGQLHSSEHPDEIADRIRSAFDNERDHDWEMEQRLDDEEDDEDEDEEADLEKVPAPSRPKWVEYSHEKEKALPYYEWVAYDRQNSARRLLIAMKEWREKEDQPLYQLKMLATAEARFGKEWWLISTEL